MSKHTPGPWVFDNHSPAIPVLGVYCADNKSPFYGDRSDQELEANARLIAAAPDLLETAVAVAAWWKAYIEVAPQSDHLENAEWAEFFKLNIAIAKARGAA